MTNKPHRLALIGAGMMGGAILSGLLRQHILTPEQITASDPSDDRLDELRRQYRIHTTSDNHAAVATADTIIIAVKPQVVGRVLEPLAGAIPADALCISVVAGTNLSTLVALLHHPHIVRTMPNTPAQVGAGMTVWTATQAVTAAQRGWVSEILATLGTHIYTDQEGAIDMATAISGSGPAYVFLILEAIIDAGVRIGLPRAVVTELATQTVYGAIVYARESGTHPAILRNAVTSPGGTTAEGLYELERGNLRQVITDAVTAAYRRAQELGAPQTELPAKPEEPSA